MDNQLSFFDCEFTHKRRVTRKEKFLRRMEVLVPWSRLEAVIEPHYPKPGKGRTTLNHATNSLPTTMVQP